MGKGDRLPVIRQSWDKFQDSSPVVTVHKLSFHSFCWTVDRFDPRTIPSPPPPFIPLSSRKGGDSKEKGTSWNLPDSSSSNNSLLSFLLLSSERKRSWNRSLLSSLYQVKRKEVGTDLPFFPLFYWVKRKEVGTDLSFLPLFIESKEKKLEPIFLSFLSLSSQKKRSWNRSSFSPSFYWVKRKEVGTDLPFLPLFIELKEKKLEPILLFSLSLSRQNKRSWNRSDFKSSNNSLFPLFFLSFILLLVKKKSQKRKKL